MRTIFNCIDAHTCGNPVRVVREGGPQLSGDTMSEKRQHFLKEYDWIRKGLMFEPRGHDMMSGSILYPPSSDNFDIGILFIETSGCLPMCGHGTIGTVTVMIEEKLVEPKIPGQLRLETPAGLVNAYYTLKGDKVASVKLVNVPAYLHSSGLEINHSELGKLFIDVAYGGNFYGIIDPQENYRDMADFSADQLVRMSREIRRLVNEKYTFEHPQNPTINGMSHVLWTGAAIDPLATSRNAVFYGDKAIDRSPCGTGTSARMAQWAAKGVLKVGDRFVHESIIGSLFIGTIEKEVQLAEKNAIIPGVEGWAKITGYNQIIIDDEDDPFAHGFQVI